MKFFLHFPLFLIILVIYNLALMVNRDGSPEAAVTPNVVQSAPALPPSTEAPAPAVVAVPGEAVLPNAPAPAPEVQPVQPVPAPPPAASPAPAVTIHPLDKGLFSIPLPSGAKMPVSTHEFLLILAVIFLYLELFKSTRTSNATIVEHVFSLVVFMLFFVELIVYRPAGTPTFLIMTLLAFLDVIAGFTITISTARRDFGMGSHGGEAA